MYAMKTTQKGIKNAHATDITHWQEKEVRELLKAEGYFTVIAYSTGIYGMTAALYQGYNTNRLYKVTCRSTVIYMI